MQQLSRLQLADQVATRALDQWRAILNPALSLLESVRNPRFVVTLPVSALASVADGDVVARFSPGFAGRLIQTSAYVTDPVTTPACAVSFLLTLGGRRASGGVVALTSANFGTKGASVEGSPVTGSDTFGADDEIVVSASTSAPFAEGSGVIVLSFG